MGETYFTPQEVADKFGVKVITVWDWIRKGKLRALRVGGRLYRITDKHIEAFKEKYSIQEVEAQKK